MNNHERMNYWWRRAKQAEERIKAVQDVLNRADRDQNAFIRSGHIRHALDGD